MFSMFFISPVKITMSFISLNKFCYLILLILFTLPGCGSTYKNLETSNTIASFNIPTSFRNSRPPVHQEWYIFSKESCSAESDFGLIGSLFVHGLDFRDRQFLPAFFVRDNEEISIGLKADQRIYLYAKNIINANTCKNFFSFIPIKNEKYSIQQYLVSGKSYEITCEISVIEKSTSKRPRSLLMHRLPVNCQ